ncbi:hypothetical protein [Parafilimonas terrae]|jgi:hypothetical protein|uniref:DUF4410 domain-containing protein n=1 Tax=Parafilimonas terrae TaxID=1465490 RepID=A0A1I5R6C3_9BACT|nr:hypothetical protein [Parafilimonas terrae]SFP53907.1 hypothetical protein SAMN05444277_10192 [Parafilimonas terrae]
MKKLLALAAIALFAFSGNLKAQKIKVLEGSIDAVKTESSLNLEYTYDNMSVGKFDKEEDYIAKKKEDYNNKEAGRGDTWAKAWVDDRKNRFEPKFEELFTEYSDKSNSKKAKYTLIFKTVFTEPGYNVGVMRKNAQINAIVLIVETANPANVIAKISVDKALGRTFGGYDFDTGGRIAEAYADAGKALGKYLK